MEYSNFQMGSWHRLFNESAANVLACNSFDYKGVSVAFALENGSDFLQSSEQSYRCLNVRATFSKGDLTFAASIPLIELPILGEDGVIIDDVSWAPVNTTHPASGWYILEVKKATTVSRVLELKRNAYTILTIDLDKSSKGEVQFNSKQRRDDGVTSMPLFEFLAALAAVRQYKASEIYELLEDCKPIRDLYLEKYSASNSKVPFLSGDKAASKLLCGLTGYTADYQWKAPIAELGSFLELNRLNIGEERIPRFKRFCSFSRAKGAVLAESVKLDDGTVLEAGEVLTDRIIRKLDRCSSITAISARMSNGDQHLLEKFEAQKGICFDEVVCALRVYSQVLQGIGSLDDPDELCNKVVYSICEDYCRRIESAAYRLKKDIMANLDHSAENELESLINSLGGITAKPRVSIDDTKRDMIGSKCYQQFDEANSISNFDQSQRLTTDAVNVTKSARDIHPMQYGRICPYTTSESKQVGLNLVVAQSSRIDRYGFITTPIYTFSNGKLNTDSGPRYISALDEYTEVIAPASINLEEIWEANKADPAYRVDDCRVNGQIIAAPLSEITAQYVSNIQTIGLLPSNAPASNMDSPKRLIMCASAQRQAMVPAKVERPLTTTAVEALYGIGVTTAKELITQYLEGHNIDSAIQADARVYLDRDALETLNNTLVARFRLVNGNVVYSYTKHLGPCRSTQKKSLKYTRLAPMPMHADGEYYSLADVVFYNSDVDISPAEFNRKQASFGNLTCDMSNTLSKHGLAIGNNCRVMFKSFEGYTYEDSIVVTESFLMKHGLAIVRTRKVKFTLRDSKGERVERSTISAEAPQIGDDGYPVRGVYVQTGQAILSVIGKDKNGEDYPSPRILDVAESGYVISCSTKRVDKNTTVVSIELGDILDIESGDKLEGLHGNKGVIGRIIKDSEAPYTEDGEIPDIIMNPFGILARLNLGQLLEYTLGAIADVTGKIHILEPFTSVSLQDVLAEAKENFVVEKDIYDGRTGLRFHQKAMIGNMYMLRLEHTSTSKYNATGDCRSHISTRTRQPQQGFGGGQRISELGTWCISSYGADGVLGALFTTQSDAVNAKHSLDMATKENKVATAPFSSNNLELLQAYMHLLGVHISTGDETYVEPLTKEYLEQLCFDGTCGVCDATPRANTRIQTILHDPSVFGANPHDTERSGLLPLGCEIIMPIFLREHGVAKMFVFMNEDGELKAGSKNLFSNIIAGNCAITGWKAIDTDSSTLQQYSLDDLVDCEVPVVMGLTKDNRNDNEQQTGIGALVDLFKRYDLRSSLCSNAIEQSALESVLLFIRRYNTYSLKQLVVSYLLLPPVGYRMISENDTNMSNPIDAALHKVVVKIQNIRSQEELHQDIRHAVNDLYNELLNASFANKNLDSGSVPSLCSQLSDHKTKTSVMRDTILSKRVSYSGRSVICLGPQLPFGTCGVPVCMLTTIFSNHINAVLSASAAEETYLISKIYKSLPKMETNYIRQLCTLIANENLIGFKEYTIDRMPTAPEQALAELGVTGIYQLFDKCYEELAGILAELMKKYPVLLNREPSLHELSIQGFDVVPVRGHVIVLHPLNCHGFNADFDGDQMMCVFPMHEQAISGIRDKMMSRNSVIDPKNGESALFLTQDMILGLYWATIHKNNTGKFAPTEVAAVFHLPKFTKFEEPVTNAIGVCSQIADCVYAGLLDIHDTIACTYNGKWYLAEAGKFLINSLLPGGIGFTGSAAELTEVNGQQVYKLCGNYIPAEFVRAAGIPDKQLCNLLVDYKITKGTLGTLEKACAAYFSSSSSENDSVGALYNRLMSFGFKMADLSGVTLSLYDMGALPVKRIIKDKLVAAEASSKQWDNWFDLGMCSEEEHDSGVTTQWIEATMNMKKLLAEKFKSEDNTEDSFDRTSNIFMIVDSGARGNVAQLLEMAGVIGVVTNSVNKTLPTPVKRSYLDGLTPEQFMQNSYTGRRQIAAAQLVTADAGAFTRKCIYLNEHLHIRYEDERCDASGVWIDLHYTTEISSGVNFSKYPIVLDADEINQVPEEVWDTGSGVPLQADYYRRKYTAFCAVVQKTCKSHVYSNEFSRLLDLLNMEFFITKDSDGIYHAVTVTFALTKESHNMLLYRVLDTDLMETEEATKGYANAWHNCENSLMADVPQNFGTNLVVNEAILENIAVAHLRRIPIFTILGCKCTNGICRHCFGVKYDTHKFPSLGEHIGYQAVQAISNPLTQIILDSHKVEVSTEKSEKDQLNEILGGGSSMFDPNSDDTDDDEAYEQESAEHDSAAFALADAKISIEAAETGFDLNLLNDGKLIQTVHIDSLEELLCGGDLILNDQDEQGNDAAWYCDVSEGTLITQIDPSQYSFWWQHADINRVKTDIWERLCRVFKKDSVLARNFEVFTRSLTEYGVAASSDMDAGVIRGSIHRTSQLDTLGIDYTPVFLSYKQALKYSGKILTDIALGHAAQKIVFSAITGTAESHDSNIGRMLVGDYSNTAEKPYSDSVVRPPYEELSSWEDLIAEESKEDDDLPLFDDPLADDISEVKIPTDENLKTSFFD